MGLFKKKDSVVKDIAKQEKQKKKQASQGDNKAAVQKGRLLTYWLYQPAVFLLVTFIAALAVQEFLFVQSISAEQNKRNEALALSYVSSNVAQFVDDREADIAALSASNVAQAALSDKQLSADLAQLFKGARPDLQNLYLIPSEMMAGVRMAYPELSFASVDLLRTAASGKASDIEAFASGDQWSIQLAQPIARSITSENGEQNTKVLGMILAIYDTSELKEYLKTPAGIAPGKLELKPNVDGLTKAIVVSGNASGASMISETISGSNWVLSFAADKARQAEPDRIILWLSIGVSALLSIIAVGVLCRMHMAKVRQDLIDATRVIRAVMTGEGKKSGELYYAEMNGLVGVVKQLAREQRSEKTSPAATAESTASKNVAGDSVVPMSETKSGEEADTDDAPLFDDDLLDLDVLDEADQASDLKDVNEDEMVQEVERLDLDVPQSIFRAYDIRGVVDDTLNESVVELIGKAFASEALAQGQTQVCVGYDGRLSSVPYCEALTKGIISTGAEAIVVGLVPTPVLYFATHHLQTGTGVMITGSHNPSNYNGFKMMIGGNTLAGDDIQKLYNRIVLQGFAQGNGERKECDVSRDYLDTILNDIAVAAPLKVVVDAGNGVAGDLGPALVEELGCEVIPLFCEIDGTFPNHHPDPGKPKNLQDLIAAVKEHKADLGLAFDGDGDRVGVVTNTGKIIWPDRLLMLFAKDVVSRNPGADIIFDVKCSRRLNGLITGYGGRPVMWKTGHSLIKAKMKETGALLAGEMSGHIFFKERWLGFDDGLYSAARLLEILGIEDNTADEVFEAFPEDVSTPEINIDVTDESKFTIVEKLCQLKGNFTDGNVSTIDGLRVDFENGWGLCRASNTTPMLVLRFEADDEAALEEIKEKFKAQLAVVDPDLNLDF